MALSARALRLEARWVRIRGQMESAAQILETQGTLDFKEQTGKRLCRLRYREPTQNGSKRRTIYIGTSAVLIRRVSQLLASYRERAAVQKETEALASLVLCFGAGLRRRMSKSGRRARAQAIAESMGE